MIMDVSITMFMLTETISSTVMLLQWVPGSRLQEYDIGRHSVRKTQRKEKPYTETTKTKVCAAMRKGLVVKIRMYR